MSTIPYSYNEAGVRFIPGYTSFDTEYLNELAYTYKLKSNRVVNTRHNLPYSFNNIQVQTNEPVAVDTINTKISLLYQNYVHLLTRCKVAKADAISDYRGPVLLTSDIYTNSLTAVYKTDYKQYLNIEKLSKSVLNDIKQLELTSNVKPGYNSIVGITDKEIKLYQIYQSGVDQTNCIITAISKPGGEGMVDSNSDLTYTKLEDLAVTDSGMLFVLDRGTNIIYRYNIRGLTTDDRVLLSKTTRGRLLTGKLGGSGEINESIKFKDARKIIFANDRLYVIDKDESQSQLWLKEYDINLNYIGGYNLSLDYLTRDIISFCVDKQSRVYILTDNGYVVEYKLSDLRLGDYSSDRETLLTNVDSEMLQNERYLDIKLSTFNTNTIYILTDKTLYKKYIDQIDIDVGDVEWNRLDICSGKITPRTFTLYTHHETLGDMMLLTVTDNNSILPTNLLLNCVDKENQIDFLQQGYEDQIYKLDEVYIHPQEYVTAFVYNKMLYKMYFNLKLIIDNLHYIASTEMSETGEKLYPGVRYISRSETMHYNVEPTIIDGVGVNELLSSTMINRSLNQLYHAQLKVLNLLQDRRNDEEFFNNTVLEFKRYPVKHTHQKLSNGVTYRIAKIN